MVCTWCSSNSECGSGVSRIKGRVSPKVMEEKCQEMRGANRKVSMKLGGGFLAGKGTPAPLPLCPAVRVPDVPYHLTFACVTV